MHQWPLRRAALQHSEWLLKGANGPVTSVTTPLDSQLRNGGYSGILRMPRRASFRHLAPMLKAFIPLRASADLAAPERRVIGCEVAVCDPEIPLQLDGVTCGQRHHGLEPEGGCFGTVIAADLPKRPPDFGRAV